MMHRSAALLLLLLAALATCAVPAASARSGGAGETTGGAGETTFVGRFACAGTGAPVVGARVELHVDYPNFGRYVPTEPPGGVANAETGSDGEWSFTVRRAQEGYVSTNDYTPVLILDTPALGIVDYMTGAPVQFQGFSHKNDVGLSDFRTLAVPTNVCTLWNQLRASYVGYVRLMGKAPRYGKLRAEYNVPNIGYPYTSNTTIMWPENAAIYDGTIPHEFAHTIRNASLGGEAAFLEEVSDADFRLRLSPCRLTTPRYAFHEGWAGFWAADFYPAPNCPGVNPSDAAVEGNVAWMLTRLERGCAAVSRRRMVQVLIDRGPTIHSLRDFVAALGTCQALPLDPGSVPRFEVAPPVSPSLFSRDIHAAVTRERSRLRALTRLLPGLDQAAAGASCQRPPCTEAIARKITAILARAQLRQGRLIASTLSARVSPGATAEFRKRPTQTSLKRVVDVPATLARGLGRIGFTSMTRALVAARPLATRDRSAPTRSLILTLTRFRSRFARASRTGSGLPSGFRLGGEMAPTVPSVRTRHVVTFDGLATGTPITTQTARVGVSFGSAAALAFRGRLPAYVCPAGPSAAQGAAVAPACDSPLAGFVYNGTLARLVSPARTVSIRVGATEAIPGGLPAEIDAFDGAGELVTRNAVLVGSSTNGQGAGPVTSLSVTVPRRAAIRFVAIFVNTLISSRSRLVFDDLGFTE
jgi:hypothetical protein